MYMYACGYDVNRNWSVYSLCANDEYCVLTYFKKIYKFPPICAKFINFSLFSFNFLLSLRFSASPYLDPDAFTCRTLRVMLYTYWTPLHRKVPVITTTTTTNNNNYHDHHQHHNHTITSEFVTGVGLLLALQLSVALQEALGSVSPERP